MRYCKILLVFKSFFYVLFFLHVADASDDIEGGLSSSGVKSIQDALQSQRSVLDSFKEKNSIVFLGDTGAGKSTLVNLLHNVPLKVTTEGRLDTQNPDEGMKIGFGGVSVTKCPQSLMSESLGLLCDLPGFEDTEGAVDDLLNAAFIRHVLTSAQSVRAVFVTSIESIVAVRAQAFKRLLCSMRLFTYPEFLRQSSLLVVNRVAHWQTLDNIREQLSKAVCGTPDGERMLRFFTEGKIVLMPATVPRDKVDVLFPHRQSLMTKIRSLKAAPVPSSQLNMAITFNVSTQNSLVMLFYDLMIEAAKNVRFLQDTRDNGLRQLEGSLQSSPVFMLLFPLGRHQYDVALDRFKPFFAQKYESHAQSLRVKKLQDETRETEKRLEALLDEKKRAEDRVKNAEGKTAAAEAARQKEIDRIKSLEKEVLTTKQEQQKIAEEKKRVEQRIQEAERSREESRKESSSLRGELAQINRRQEEMRRRLKEAEETEQKARTQLEDLNATKRQLQSSMAGVRKEEAEKQRLMRELEEAKEEIRRQKELKQRLMRELEEAKEEIERNERRATQQQTSRNAPLSWSLPQQVIQALQQVQQALQHNEQNLQQLPHHQRMAVVTSITTPFGCLPVMRSPNGAFLIVPYNSQSIVVTQSSIF